MSSKAQLTLEEIEALIGPQGVDASPAGGTGIWLPHMPVPRMLRTLRPHEHVALLYESEEERERVVKQFILAGLRRGEACVVLHEPDFLERVRVSTDPELTAASTEYTGRLILLDRSEFATAEGRIDYGLLRERVARERGGPPLVQPQTQAGTDVTEREERSPAVMLRVVREPAPSQPGTHELTHYLRGEASFEGDFCARTVCVALDLVDRSLPPSLVKAVVSTHPCLVAAGRFYRNDCTVPASRYARIDATELDIRRIIRRIGERHAEAMKEEFLESVLAGSSLPFLAVWPDGRILTCNEAFLRLLGYGLDEIRLLSLGEDLVPPEWLDVTESSRAELLATGQPQRFETELARKDRAHVPVRIVLDLMTDDEGEPECLHAFIQDLSERRAGESLVRSAYNLPVAGLPDRSFFVDRLGQALNRANRRLGYRFTVQIIEFERLGLMADCLGQKPLDDLLGSVSSRLDKNVRSLDTPAHFDTNQFAVLLEEIGDATQAIRIAQRVQEEVCRSFHIMGCDIATSCRIGIVMGSADYETPEHILRDASAALARARTRPGKGIEIFDSLTHDQAMKFLQLEDDLERALTCCEMVVLYQPVMDLRSGRIVGFEALPRWNHPERGLLMPPEFLPVAETTGLIHVLEPWVLREACSQLKAWQQRLGDDGLYVSVNISSKNFLRIGFISTIDETLAVSAIPPRTLKIEISEDTVMENPDLAKSMVDALTSREIDLFLDDFGTGFSSLSLLHSLPIDTVKIDGSSLKAHGMIRNIVSLARTLDMDVISEGVETEDELEQVRKADCPYGQGFFLARPMSRDDASALLGQRAG